MSKISYKIDLRDFTNKPTSEMAHEVAELLRDKVLEYASKAKSPVSGESWKKSLNKDYKKIKSEESNNLTANMELHGDMLDALEIKSKKNIIEIGIWDTDEAKKLDGHGHYGKFGTSKLPRRRLLPDENQKFKRDILMEIQGLINDIKD